MSSHDNSYKSSVKVWHSSVCHNLPGTMSGHLVLSSVFCDRDTELFSCAELPVWILERILCPQGGNIIGPCWSEASSQESINWSQIL